MPRAAEQKHLQPSDLETATLNFPDVVFNLFMLAAAKYQFFYSDILPASPAVLSFFLPTTATSLTHPTEGGSLFFPIVLQPPTVKGVSFFPLITMSF